MRREVDLHGLKVTDAIQKVHSVVGNVRLTGEEEDWCFITGSGGSIQTAVVKELQDYGFETEIPAHNLGVVLTTVE